MTLPSHHSDHAARYRERGWWHEGPIPDRLAETAARSPQKIAVIDDTGSLSYSEFDLLVTRAAAGLAAEGIGPGDAIGIQLPNRIAFAVFQQAAVRAGATYLPLLPQLRESELGYLLGVVRAKLLIIPDVCRRFDHRAMVPTLRTAVPSLARILVDGAGGDGCETVADFLAEPHETTHPGSFPAPDADARRLVIFTSGTESKPKAVLHSHATTFFPLDSHARIFEMGPQDVVFTPSPVGHGTGAVFGVELGLHLGGTVVLMDGWDAGRAVRRISETGATMMWGATTFCAELAEAAGPDAPDLSRFRLLLTAGAPIPRDLVRRVRDRIGATLVSAYGQSEGQNITIARPGDPPEKITGSDGRFLEGIEHRLVTPEGKLAAPGTEGEILYRGPNTCLGYLDTAHNADAFTEDGFFRSGDLGVLDGDGYLRIVGRRKEIIIRGGENISPAEVEDLVGRHPQVAEVAVIGLPDDRLGQRACAAVIPRPGAPLTLTDITGFMATLGVAKFKYPERLELVDVIPRTASGKIRRDVLRDQILERSAD
ncbi:AMP-binding protein [Tropicimonas isoalkanivorans]|uniref:Cyclohexanecarboxylate-CoA ligase n=1 Tax=Tropicimonas isoalkanivorans TaxID=441112 RepID=A0A1I1I0A3_9RHOB|nr:AMP-binding protein [Tropicimonas isoalkanivorans]SFC27103.1 cyclohexanecarboxylate-CoA ligase [Tropicimonas isoalkanivorans]